MIRLRFHSSSRALAGLLVAAALVFYLRGTVRAASVFRLRPILSITEMYNDNVLFSPSNAKGDFVTQALMGAYLDLNSPTSDTRLQYSTLAQKYAHYSQYDSVGEGQYVTLKHQQDLSPETSIAADDYFIKGNLTSSVAPAGSLAFNPSLGRAALQNNGYWSNGGSVYLTHDFSQELNSTLGLHQTTFSNGSAGYSFDQGGMVALRRSIMSTLWGGFRYRMDDYRYSNESPAESHLIQLSLGWNPTERLGVDANAGPAIIHVFGGPTLVRPGYIIDLRYSGQKWAARAGGGETPSLGAGYGGAGVSQGGSGSFSYQLGQYTSLLAHVSYNQYSTSGFNGDMFGYGVGINSRLTRWLTVYAQYNGYRRSLGSGSTAAVRGIGLPAGSEAVQNLYMIGAEISFDLLKRAI